MKNKKPISKEAVQFNARYADLEAAANLVNKDLLKSLSFVKKISKKAKRLYDYGNKHCYEHLANHAIEPVDGISCLDQKMDLLDWLKSADAELKDFAHEFNIKF